MAWGLLTGLTGCGGSTEGSPAAGPDLQGTGGSTAVPAKKPTRPPRPQAPEVEPEMDAAPEPIPTEEELAAEVERIAGTSFSVDSEESSSPYCQGGYSYEVPPFIGPATFHFRRSEAGTLELVSSLDGPWLKVDSAALIRVAGGWRVEPPLPTGACIGYAFEEENAIALPTPTLTELAFRGADAMDQPTSLEVRSHFDATDGHESRVVVASGIRDTRAPQLRPLPSYLVLNSWGEGKALTVANADSYDRSFLDDYFFDWDLPRSFVFTEAMAPGWTASLRDPQGNVVELARSRTDGSFEIGFDVAAYYPAGYHWLLSGTDLAGNPIESGGEYPSGALERCSGDFETPAEIAIYSSSYYETGGTSGPLPACETSPDVGDTCSGHSPPGLPDLEALEGSSSLWLHDQVFLRIARKAGATQLRFQARAASGAIESLPVGVMPLDAGSTLRLKMQRVATASPEDPVRIFSLPIPAGTGDLLVAIGSAGGYHDIDGIWVDSVRTE
jgi:hypothetical protein